MTTGTCSFCGRGNLKVSDDRVSRHGFRLHYGNAKGECPGSRRFAAEIDKAGALSAIVKTSEVHADLMEKVEKPGLADGYRAVAKRAQELAE